MRRAVETAALKSLLGRLLMSVCILWCSELGLANFLTAEQVAYRLDACS